MSAAVVTFTPLASKFEATSISEVPVLVDSLATNGSILSPLVGVIGGSRAVILMVSLVAGGTSTEKEMEAVFEDGRVQEAVVRLGTEQRLVAVVAQRVDMPIVRVPKAETPCREETMTVMLRLTESGPRAWTEGYRYSMNSWEWLQYPNAPL